MKNKIISEFNNNENITNNKSYATANNNNEVYLTKANISNY